MRELRSKSNYFKKIKTFLCLKISGIIVSLYNRFRTCSGLKAHTDMKKAEFKKNEVGIALVYEKMPKVQEGIVKLQEEVKNLELALEVTTSDILLLSEMHKNAQYYEMRDMFNKYVSLIVIEKKNFKEEVDKND